MMDNRRRLIKLTCVAQRDLGMDEDTFRAFLHATVGKSSRKEMSAAELERVVEALKRKGFRVRHRTVGAARGRDRSRALDQAAQSSKIRALWLALCEAGAVRDQNESALASFCRRQTGVDDLRWLSSEQSSRLIEALKRWCRRLDIDTDRERTA
jgi:phage gp16-like protein